MPKINIQLIPATGFTKKLRDGVAYNVSRQWTGRVAAQSANITKEIGLLLEEALETSPVMKALRGYGGEDLPAHLGLSDKMANGLANGMIAIIKKSVMLSIRHSKYKASVRIRAGEKNWSEYLQLPGAQYISHPSNTTIPVLRWLLIDPNIDIGAAAYDIVFSGEQGGRWDVQIQKVSRSGRAIMISLDNLGGSGGYVLPSIISGGAGENFIEYALGRPNVLQVAAQIAMKRVM